MPKARQLDDALMDNLQRAVVTIHSGSVAAEYRQAAQRVQDPTPQTKDSSFYFLHKNLSNSVSGRVQEDGGGTRPLRLRTD